MSKHQPPDFLEALAARSINSDRSIYRLMQNIRRAADARIGRPKPVSSTKAQELLQQGRDKAVFMEGINGLVEARHDPSTSGVYLTASVLMIERTAARIDPVQMAGPRREAIRALRKLTQVTAQPESKAALQEVLQNVRNATPPQLVSLSGVH